jgi:hypothetical protein
MSQVQYELSWETPSFADDSHGCARDDITIWHWRTPSDLSGIKNGSISLVEHANASGGAAVPCAHYGSLSLTPGDISGGIDGYGVFSDAVAPDISFDVSGGVYKIQLEPDTDYYFNVGNGFGPGDFRGVQAGVEVFSVKVTLSLHAKSGV